MHALQLGPHLWFYSVQVFARIEMPKDSHSTDANPSSQLRVVGALAGVGSGTHNTFITTPILF